MGKNQGRNFEAAKTSKRTKALGPQTYLVEKSYENMQPKSRSVVLSQQPVCDANKMKTADKMKKMKSITFIDIAVKNNKDKLGPGTYKLTDKAYSKVSSVPPSIKLKRH